jgi:hypothetical protein
MEPSGSESKGVILVKFGVGGGAIGFRFGEKDLAKEVVRVCGQTIQDLCKGDTVGQVAEDRARMALRIKELEEQLDPMILRLLILRTRCDLCPV